MALDPHLLFFVAGALAGVCVAIFIALVTFVVPVPMYMLGTIVVVVQTLVFCMLSTVYISMAIAHEEH